MHALVVSLPTITMKQQQAAKAKMNDHFKGTPVLISMSRVKVVHCIIHASDNKYTSSDFNFALDIQRTSEEKVFMMYWNEY